LVVVAQRPTILLIESVTRTPKIAFCNEKATLAPVDQYCQLTSAFVAGFLKSEKVRRWSFVRCRKKPFDNKSGKKKGANVLWLGIRS